VGFIRQVDHEMVEAGLAFGARPPQLLWQVQLPLAMASIMAGVNQVIMMSLSMVVIAGMVGAGGLGQVVVTGISRLDVGAEFEGGIAVVRVSPPPQGCRLSAACRKEHGVDR
jgi:glycine betaine/proline transport system permease protein